MSQRTFDITAQANHLEAMPRSINKETLANSNSLKRVFAITRNTFREAVRDRVLYNLVLFVLILTACAIFIGELSADNEAKIIIDLGLSASLVFGAFISIFVGTGLVYKEIERRTIYTIFSKPVGRGEFLIGKYLGLCLTLLVNVVVMCIGILLALAYVRGGWDAQLLSVPPAMLFVYLELVIIIAIALLFSTFSSPALSALFTFALFIVGHFSRDIYALAESIGSYTARLFFSALYFLLPNFSNHAFITPAGHGALPSLELVGHVTLYTMLYVAVLLCAATLIFKRRNFK